MVGLQSGVLTIVCMHTSVQRKVMVYASWNVKEKGIKEGDKGYSKSCWYV